jgi:hypothetical protein
MVQMYKYYPNTIIYKEIYPKGNEYKGFWRVPTMKMEVTFDGTTYYDITNLQDYLNQLEDKGLL